MTEPLIKIKVPLCFDWHFNQQLMNFHSKNYTNINSEKVPHWTNNQRLNSSCSPLEVLHELLLSESTMAAFNMV